MSLPTGATPLRHHPAPTDPVAPTGLPTADEAVAHTLLNCLVRELSGPEHQTAVSDGHLLLRLPRRGVLLRVALRRRSLLGAHRFSGPVTERHGAGWVELDCRRLAEHVSTELSLRTGVRNAEFLDQVAASHQVVSTLLAARTTTGSTPNAITGSTPSAATGAAKSTTPNTTPNTTLNGATPAPTAQATPDAATTAYLASEQSLLFGHRFHPTPKARSADLAAWSAYAPEARATFPLRLLAVRAGRIAQESATDGALAPLDRLAGRGVPDGYLPLPAHPWQWMLLRQLPALVAAQGRGDVLDLGPCTRPFAATASVRTLYDGETFLKFSLNVRITNCLRKNARYELAGAVALTRILQPVLADLQARFPGSAVLREPAYRTLALPGDPAVPGVPHASDGPVDLAAFEGFGVIVREGLRERLRPGSTALLAAALADEYPTGPAHISRLLAGTGESAALDWWAGYLDLLVPPVLAAYFEHGVVLEPHLQNVLVCVADDGTPTQVIFRDLEGTKLLAERHAATLATLPPDVAGPLTYDARRGWDRVVYCLLVNHVAELLAALADRHPHLESALWARVKHTIQGYADTHGCPPRLAALLAGVPLPAKANLLTRWERKADRAAGYVRLASPFPLAGLN